MDLRTKYMGLELRNPLVVSPCPLTERLDNIRRMEDMGAGAVVLFSLFEEQLRHEAAAAEHFLSHGSECSPEALSYFPRIEEYSMAPDHYLELVRSAREAVDIPVIGSLNGVTSEGWVGYAREIQQAGASGIELNVYYIPAELARSGREVEQRYAAVLESVKAAVSIPVAVKISPYFSSPGWMCRQLDAAGADALVLFNRFFQPDIDIQTRQLVTELSKSSSDEVRLRVLWLGLLHGKVNASLAATGGVHTHEQVIKYLMAGADAVMTASALVENGIDYLGFLRVGLLDWLRRHDYESVDELKGSLSHGKSGDPDSYERAQYVRLMERYKSIYGDVPAA